jgi:transposase-like protein
MTRRYYNVEFKTRVCEDYLNSDMTYEELSGKYEVNPSTLAKWVGIYREHGAQGFEKQPRKSKNTGKMPEILTEIDRTYPLKSSDRKLEEQNQRLKNLVAEKEIEIQILRETIKKKMKQPLTMQ